MITDALGVFRASPIFVSRMVKEETKCSKGGSSDGQQGLTILSQGSGTPTVCSKTAIPSLMVEIFSLLFYKLYNTTYLYHTKILYVIKYNEHCSNQAQQL